MSEGLVLAILAALAVGVVAAIVLRLLRRRRIEASLQTLLARDPRWRRDTALCGRGAAQLAGAGPATPRGDRRYGLAHVITGPLEVAPLGTRVLWWASCGIWWYEDEQHSSDEDGGTTRTYTRREVPVVAVALPVTVPTSVSIGAESLFGRLGLTRGGQQVESDAFNRRFRVEGGDPTLTIQLLDARFQQHLLAGYAGRSLWIAGDLVVLGGETDRADTSLSGPIRALPGLQADAADVLGHVPAQFWRSVGLAGPS